MLFHKKITQIPELHIFNKRFFAKKALDYFHGLWFITSIKIRHSKTGNRQFAAVSGGNNEKGFLLPWRVTSNPFWIKFSCLCHFGEGQMAWDTLVMWFLLSRNDKLTFSSRYRLSSTTLSVFLINILYFKYNNKSGKEIIFFINFIIYNVLQKLKWNLHTKVWLNFTNT